MSRGKKLDLFVGANIEDGWSEITTSSKKTPSHATKTPQQHTLFFSKEKRRGKTVTLVGEFFLEKQHATTLLKKLKKSLGCGGSLKDGFMEFQGDLKEKIRPLLVEESFRFKPKH